MFKGLFEKIQNIKMEKKSLSNLLILFLVGLLMLITINFLSGSNDSGKEKNQNQSSDLKSVNDYEAQVQNKLKETLEKVEGVGTVEVMVSFECGEEQVPALNITDSTNSTEEKDTEGGTRNTTQNNNGTSVVITNDGSKSEPLIVKTYKPKVIGVCVVAEGAESKLTELRISKAVMNLFSITEDKVNVYPMKR
ncbi:MAG: stage III sporulation protein AG [Solirubrobacterales bacterium]